MDYFPRVLGPGLIVHLWQGPNGRYMSHDSGRVAFWEPEPLTGWWMWRLSLHGSPLVNLGYVRHDSQAQDWCLKGILGFH